MKYIWINPVTAGMYAPAVLHDFLERHGYEQVTASGDWLTIVKEKYRTATAHAAHTVIDQRCPVIGKLVEAYDLSPSVTQPDIEPILIHCGREISERKDLRGTEKLITTPCKALADMGNALHLPETRFLPWNEFIKETGGSFPASTLGESPIPPGFFDGMGLTLVSVSGTDEIHDYFETYKPDEVQLAELLFCKNGCHNGDGVRMCDAFETGN